MGKLPKNTPLGKIVVVKLKTGRRVKFKRIALKGFPQWRITK